MKIKNKLIYIGVSRYSFVPDGQKDKLEGGYIHLIDTNVIANDLDKKGMSVSKMKIKYDDFSLYQSLKPLQVYHFELEINIVGDKTTVNVVGVDIKV